MSLGKSSSTTQTSLKITANGTKIEIEIEINLEKNVSIHCLGLFLKQKIIFNDNYNLVYSDTR